MTDTRAERSEYVYELTEEQKEALLKIAARKDQPFESLVLEAIDQFIQRES